MTPILRGTAARLGLRRPLPPLEVEISVEMAAFNQSMRGVREFMERNDAAIRESFVNLSRRLQSRS